MQPHDMTELGKMGQRGMDHGTPGRGGMMSHPPMMRIIFILMDSNSDGTISLQEWIRTRMVHSHSRRCRLSCREAEHPCPSRDSGSHLLP
jgi:hypothetical protein